MQKPKQYDWKDSNLSLFGSDLEKNVKKGAAETEQAWAGAGAKPRLQVWRIVKFKVEHWPEEDTGSFYSGDSYIILHTYKPDPQGEELAHDVHFWIGKHSTQDEYGTAAYKTVELDTFLDDVPVQHREVEGHESKLFKSYFKKMVVMKGGAASGFRHVKPEEYKPRMLKFRGDKKTVEVTEDAFNIASLQSDDVFIVDLGLQAYVWVGKKANKDERFKALQFTQELKGERRGKLNVETLEEGDLTEKHPLIAAFDKHSESVEDDEVVWVDTPGEKSVFRLSDAGGAMQFSKENPVRSSLNTNDVFILDDGAECIVWIGKKASAAEKKNAMMYAHKYLQGTKHPLVPISVAKEGHHMIDAFF